MKRFVAAFVILLSAFASAPAATGNPPDRIDVVYVDGAMFYSIEDGGQGRMVGAEPRTFTFETSHEDFMRVRELLRPLETRGIPCADAESARFSQGYMIWRRDGVERRAPAIWSCREIARDTRMRTDRAYELVREMGRSRWRAEPMPAPTKIAVTWSSWGNLLRSWSIERGGEGRITDETGAATFAVSAEDFDRVRDVFRSHEGTWFECRRMITDMPYGAITWSQAGQADQSISFDAGCISGDADTLFQQLDGAEAIVKSLRAAAPR